VVYRDVTRQAKGLYRLKHVGALRIGLAYLSRYNSGWFCHTSVRQELGQMLEPFSYNNSFQTSLKMAPFEALYGRRCRTPLSWSQTGERKIFGPDLVTEAEENMKTIQNNLKAAQSQQKSYADIRRRPLQFQVGNFVYLRVSPTRGIQRFGIKGKLAPRYIGPFEIIKVCGPVAYRLQLPPQLAAIHDIFHVSQLIPSIRSNY
jgi:hypothetical protein